MSNFWMALVLLLCSAIAFFAAEIFQAVKDIFKDRKQGDEKRKKELRDFDEHY
jgi:4-hydroxybenzoate polyprenyltransferase